MPNLKRDHPQAIWLWLESILRGILPIRHLLGGFTRFVPDQDTVTEVLIVLGIVTMIFFLSKSDNLQSVTRQVSPYVSEASPR